MSSVKIKGSPTGTAAFTIAVPDGTSTDRTIELPDAAGSFVLADASGDVTVSGDLTVDKDTTTSYGAKLVITNGQDYGYGSSLDFAMPLSSGGAVQTAASIRAGYQSIDDGFLAFYTTLNSTLSEAGRFDKNGNLLVGKTSTGVSNYGFAARADTGGTVEIARDGDRVLYINRGSSNGAIIDVRKDGSAVGDLGTNSYGDFFIAGTGSNNVGFAFDVNQIMPTNSTGERNDNAKDLGNISVRWDDIYATNGTIQTSDANEKQQIASLTDAEITAAKAISKLFKTFKWNDKVAEKGDAARTHTGVIAQEVQQAMTDAGLDAGNYAFFISSTWWETQTEVPAVEAVDEVVDEDGNVVTEAVEAQEAYTRTDTYETAEEAPEGAVERTRLGIRYPELLAFIGAATEQRLASIEARLDALEAV